jgi:hypothetical protein
MYLDNLTLAGLVTVVAIVVFMLRLDRGTASGRGLSDDAAGEI